jgi:small subunit ribosomal protein S16
MATRIRLQRHGRKKAPFFHIVVADINSPRDGKFIERLGTYNPTTVPAQITIDVNKSVDWLQKGAQPTTTVNAILRYKGVLYKKHLMRGLKKGAFEFEEVDRRFDEWIRTHENSVLDHVKTIESKKTQAKENEIARITAKREERAKAKKAAEPIVENNEENTIDAAPETDAGITDESAADESAIAQTPEDQNPGNS